MHRRDEVLHLHPIYDSIPGEGEVSGVVSPRHRRLHLHLCREGEQTQDTPNT